LFSPLLAHPVFFIAGFSERKGGKMDQGRDDFETTFFRGKIRFRGGDAQLSHYQLADGSARIAVPNDIHVRLIEQIKMPPVYEIVAPMTHVVVEKGIVPESYQVREGHSYYRELEARFVPLQLADAQKHMQPDGTLRKTGCLSVVLLLLVVPVVIWRIIL
jgi:hypothetical protein